MQLGILNIVFGIWEIGVVTCLWILGVLSQIVLEYIALGHGYTILGDTWARGSTTWVQDFDTELGAPQLS
jgi:hypothetical protein